MEKVAFIFYNLTEKNPENICYDFDTNGPRCKFFSA